MAGLTPARPKPGRFAPSPKIFGEGATDNAPAGRGEGGGEAGLARVMYFDAITLTLRGPHAAGNVLQSSCVWNVDKGRPVVMRWRKGWSLGAVMLAVGLLVAACGEASPGGGIVHIADVTPTPEPTLPTPTRTPVPTGEPFVLPTLDPALDPEMPITRVGSEIITLGEYQKQVRMERFVRLYSLALTVERHGPGVLDLTNPANTYVSALFSTLAESYSFGRQVQRVMVVDALTLQEATRRGIEVDHTQFQARLAQYLNLQVGAGGALPDDFDAEYARFIEALTRYSGMSEEEFRRVVRARVLYTQLKAAILQSPEAKPPAGEGTVGVEVEDMTVPDRAQAEQIAGRLRSGESLRDIMTALGFQAASASTSRVLRFSDESLGEDVMAAVRRAAENEVVGPLPTPGGWYVARVVRPVMDTLSPADLDAWREQYFLDWMERLMDDPAWVEDYDNWIAYTPQEPLPRDVSPLLRDEYVILPASTVTATPGE